MTGPRAFTELTEPADDALAWRARLEHLVRYAVGAHQHLRPEGPLLKRAAGGAQPLPRATRTHAGAVAMPGSQGGMG